MKLFIQIPCYNEEATLPAVLADFPKEIPGIDAIEVMIVDDGSTDRTVEVAESLGIKHIVRMVTNRGLAAAFRRGTEYALAQGADILVNTDGDNQYCGADIPILVRPIIDGAADLVVGCRPILGHQEFSPLKKALQLCGSWVLRRISKTDVRDAASGFRAFSRETLLRLFIHSSFSYCMETLIQAGNIGLRVCSVDIRVNPKTRESRLFSSIPQYIRKSGGTMLEMFILYRPTSFFLWLSTVPWLLSLACGLRVLLGATIANVPYKTFSPSMLAGILLAFTALSLDSLAIIGYLLKAQRRLTEEVLYHERQDIAKHN